MSGWGFANLFGGGAATKKDAPKNAILRLRSTLEMLSKREKHLENQMAEQDAIARKNVSANKGVAKAALRRKKAFEHQLEQTSAQMMTVEREISSIETANINKETLDAMKGAQVAMKGIHAGLTIDKVDQTMEDLREQHAIGEEIADALTQGNTMQGVDEDELEDELAELQQEELDNKMLKTGTVPVSDQGLRLPSQPVGELQGRQQVEDDEEEELRKLQAEMAIFRLLPLRSALLKQHHHQTTNTSTERDVEIEWLVSTHRHNTNNDTRAMEDDGRRSESSTAEPSPIVVRRARALTAPAKITFKETAPATSKPQDDTTTSDEPETLDAEPDHRLYDADRIEVSYKWTCDRLDKRNITPRTGWALQMHQLRCLKALRHGVTDDLQREIHEFESTVDIESWLKAALPDDMYAMTQEVIALRWLQVLALVGDFVKMDCAKIREAARNMQRKGVNLSSGRYQWTEISAKLKEEKLIHEKYGDARKDQTKTYRQVYEAARYAQLDFDEVCLCIHTYGQRNGVYHNDIEEKIRKGYFSKLASTLYRTNQELYSLVPVEHQETAHLLRRYFRTLRDRWFECYELDNPDTWQATEDLKQDRIKRRQSGESSVPSTPKKPSVAVPKSSPTQTDARTKYMQTPIAAPPHYRLPPMEQMPPAQNYRPAKRDLSENAPPSGREAKRSRDAAWQTVVHRDIELHNKQQEIENDAEVYAQCKLAVATQRQRLLEKKNAHTVSLAELGNMIVDLRAVHGPDPPEDLKVEMEKLGVTEKSQDMDTTPTRGRNEPGK
ncbi:hypothetical protein TI39_contig1051g00017 [Zymoseptoria brevis]|uniref:Vacuolar-sorting protein SNF7 n=1 Tax=Zymoseptoria brevis TaxID=1047168 RepID=A0A0F4GEL8_9PEZI|nr:hypothetical protein TI39_contig1051g00017 [Zymoseptoria brevis]